MRRVHDPSSDDVEERVLHDLQNLCDTLQSVVQQAPELANAVGTTLSIYHDLLHGEFRRDIGYDVDRLLEIISAMANGYRNALFAVLFSRSDGAKRTEGQLDETRVRNLLADILELQVDGRIDLEQLRELRAEARALLTGDDGPRSPGH